MPNVGRNDPCPCGSGKKYKKCCLLTAGAASADSPNRKYMSSDWDFISEHIARPSEFQQSEDFAWFVHAGLSPEDEVELGRIVVMLYGKLRDLSPSERMAALHEIYEEKFAEIRARDTVDGKPEFICASGCANCCKQAIRATPEEVDYIFDYMAENDIQIEFDHDVLDKQVWAAERVDSRKDQAEWRRNLSPEDQNCVFLDPDSGKCRIYDARPLNCRNYFSTGSNKYCALTPPEIPADERHLKQQANYIELAQIATAYLNVTTDPRKQRNLADAVRHRLAKN
jgi:Fe-S-cluster containining protein